MRIKWHQNAFRWHGTARTPFPRFEAFRAAEHAQDQWCLNVLRGPNAGPISIRCLPSLAAAKTFAKGLLAEFVPLPAAVSPTTATAAVSTPMSRTHSTHARA